MVDEMVNQLMSAVVMIDGVAHVPVMSAVQTLVPVFFAGGGLIAAFLWVLHGLISAFGALGELLGFWLRNRIRTGKAAKTE